MAEIAGVKFWKDIFNYSSVLPVPSDRQNTESNASHPFSINLKSIEGLIPKDGKTDTHFGLRLSLFDAAYKQFFGRTWVGPVQRCSVSGQKLQLPYNQNVYFHTPVKDQSVLVVLEIVSQTHSDDGQTQTCSCGWGIFRLFAYDGEMKDVSSGLMGPVQKMSIFCGTPRALLYLDEPIEDNNNLTSIQGCHVQFHIRTHRNLRKVQHLIPENVLVGVNDHVPGLSVGSREPKSAPDSFKKPKLQKSMSCHLTNISLTLNPSIEKFEDELITLLNEDAFARGQQVTGSRIQILSRHLQIGVHNGWSYIAEPEVVNLTPSESGGSSYKKTASFRKGHKRTGSGGSVSTAGPNVNELVHRNRVEIDGVMEDTSLTLIFYIIYECGLPTSSSDKTKMSHSSFHVSVRWVPFSPINNMGHEHQTLELIGGPGQNPDTSLMFHSASTVIGSNMELSKMEMSKLSGGTLSFNIYLNQEGKENIIPGVQHQLMSMGGGRPGSPSSVITDGGGSVLHELQSQGLASSRPPLPPSSSIHGSPRRDSDLHVADFLNASQASSHLNASYASSQHLSVSHTSAAGRSGGGKKTRHASGNSVNQPFFTVPTPPPQPSRPMKQSQYPDQFGVPPLQGFSTTPRSFYGQSMQQQQQQQHQQQQQMYAQTTPRGYMPIEIQHMSHDMHSPMSTARMGIQELKELPFTPVHAPIMAVAPGMQSGNKLSRAAYAKLYTAGFPQILDYKGEAPEVVDPVDELHFVLAKEQVSKLQANEIYFQFLAYARCGSFEFANPSKQPSVVFFTFQFYRFPQITTDRLILGSPQGELSADPNTLPCILQSLEKDGTIRKGPPGYQLKYDMDPAYMKPGEGRLFAEHLSNQTLHIDVWDGDSLHLIGSCAVELRHLCRQGRNAVQVTYELDVVSTEYIEHEGPVMAGDQTRNGSVRPVDVNTTLKGRLHLRMANVGHQSDTKFNRTSTKPMSKPTKVVVSSDTAMSSFLGGSLNALNSHTKTILHTRVAKAQPLADTNQELASVLFTQKGKPGKTDQRQVDKEKARKVSRMSAVRQIEGEDGNKTVGSFRLEKEERARDLKTIDMYRQQTKRDGIKAMLSQSISTEYTLHPCMGNTEFFEFVLRNPYSHEFTVVVDSDDPDLVPVTDPREWRHFKMLNEVYTSVEEGLFNLETQSGKPEIFLKPKDKVYVPFKYLTFKADHSVTPQNPQNTLGKSDVKQDLILGKKVEDHLNTKLIKVKFRSQNDSKPLAILAVRVEPQPHIIDQTFRFHHPEQSFLKKCIRMPPLHSLPGVPVGGGGYSQVYVRCSDPNVICESKKVQQGEPHDIFIKVACGASPQVKRFFISMYLDPFMSKPLQVWQFYVHAMQRVDVACVEGQTSRFTLILKGTQASRLVQCYPSHASEMQLHPIEPFMLASNTLQELHVGVRPQQVGCKFLYINVVDIEYRQLIRSWLVCVNSRVPVISKAFELHLPIGGGKGSNKKITYTNPYPHMKVFFVRTNRDDLVQFRETTLSIAGGETATIGMKFAPNMHQGTTEIMLFINDEDDKNEEAFCIKAVYQ